MPKNRRLSKKARKAIRRANLQGNGERSKVLAREKFRKKLIKMEKEKERSVEVIEDLPTTSSASETPELTPEKQPEPKKVVIPGQAKTTTPSKTCEAAKNPEPKRVPTTSSQQTKTAAPKPPTTVTKLTAEELEAKRIPVPYEQPWHDKHDDFFRRRRELKVAQEEARLAKEPNLPKTPLKGKDLEDNRNPTPWSGRDNYKRPIRPDSPDTIAERAKEAQRMQDTLERAKKLAAAKKRERPPSPRTPSLEREDYEEEEESVWTLPPSRSRPRPPTQSMQLYHQAETWKAKYYELETEVLELRKETKKQGIEVQAREQDSRDMAMWRQRYAHLEDYCRVVKGESMNLRKDLSDMRKELDNKDRECHKLRMELHYVRNNPLIRDTSSSPEPTPRPKKPRAPRKPRKPKEPKAPEEPQDPPTRKPRALRKRKNQESPPPISPSIIDLE